MATAWYGILDTDESIEFIETPRAMASCTRLIQFCNSEVSKLINGAVMERRHRR